MRCVGCKILIAYQVSTGYGSKSTLKTTVRRKMKTISILLLVVIFAQSSQIATSKPLTSEELSKVLGYRHWRISAMNPERGNILKLSFVHHFKSDDGQWNQREHRIQTHSLPLRVNNPETSRIKEADALVVYRGGDEAFFFDIGSVRGNREFPVDIEDFFLFSDIAKVDHIDAIAAKFKNPNHTSQNKEEMLEILELKFDLIRK